MLSRRFLLAASPLLALPLPAWSAVPASKSLVFHISRKGAAIGTHSVSFSGDPASGTFTATGQMQVGIRLLGVRVFHYDHHVVETWEGGRFVSLDATTDDDGEKAYAKVQRAGDTLNVDGSHGKAAAPGTALPATHWNIAELKSPMINPQNGRMIHAQISGPSSGSVAMASGKTMAAQHYTWRGDDALDLYYAADGTWAGLTATVKDGSQLVYARA